MDDAFGSQPTTRIHTVPSTGGEPQIWTELPFACGYTELSISVRTGRVLCARNDGLSDLWVVENVR